MKILKYGLLFLVCSLIAGPVFAVKISEKMDEMFAEVTTSEQCDSAGVQCSEYCSKNATNYALAGILGAIGKNKINFNDRDGIYFESKNCHLAVEQ